MATMKTTKSLAKERAGRWTAIGAAAAVLGALAVLGLAAIASPSHGVLLRNSVLLLPGSQSTDWSPQQAPASFLQEWREAPPAIRAAADLLAPPGSPSSAEDGFDAAVGIARYLGDNPRRGGAIRGSTVEALHRLKEGGEGYCADYTQLVLALSHARGVSAREWGFGTDGFGAAHAFNEVHSRRLGKWVFLDAFNAFYVVDAASGVPMSVKEFQAALLRGDSHERVRIVRISDPGFGFRSDAEALEYFRAGAEYFYLFWGNNVFSYDANPVVGALSSVARPVEVLAAAAIGVQPRIVPLATEGNAPAIRRLGAIRAALIGALLLAVAAGLVLVWQLRAVLVHRRGAGARSPAAPHGTA
jgi:hypothetical protein